MDNFPSALVIASYESVCHDNNVLYRLVRPLPDGIGVQSTDRLVNVVPFRRKYIFEKKHQLDEFGQQILRRPLVLQPVLHFGRGLGHNCALSYQDELWLVMVNQTHPKILSRLQMGLDSAKAALGRGQPFEIRFRFGKLIQRVYREHLTQKEMGEAKKSSSAFNECMTYFRYSEWEHCDLNLRYHGYGAHLSRSSALHSLPNLEIKWDFEDIGMHEMEWRQFNDEIYPSSHLSPVYEDEIRDLLPDWTINSVSPLENIGDSIPQNNYDYAQAGRLYASFRKKGRPRNKLQHYALPGPSSSYNDDYADDPYEEDDLHDKLEGAVGFEPSVHPDFVDPDSDDTVEYNFGFNNPDDSVPQSQSRQRYQDSDSHHNDFPSNYYVEHSNSAARPQSTSSIHYTKSQSTNLPKSVLTESKPDKYGHIHANVSIVSKTPQQGTSSYADPHTESYDTVSPSPSGYFPYSEPFKKQDSDRFSRSTNADSGYCPDGDYEHSRGGSFDYSEQSYVTRPKQDWQSYEHFPQGSDMQDSDGLENPAFKQDYHDNISGGYRHEQLVSKLLSNPREGYMIKGRADSQSDTLDYSNQGPQTQHTLSHKDLVADVMKVPPRRKKVAIESSGVPQVAESYI